MRVLALLALGACSFSTSVPSPSAIDAPDNGIDAFEPPACIEGRCRRKTFTIDHTKVAGPLVKFPVFIHLADPDLAMAVPSGTDLAFVADDGATILPHERERFANNELFAWVVVPALSATADTKLYLYYGSSAVADTQNRTAVWDGNYAAVWHLSEPTGGTGAIRDSTTNVNHGSDLGGLAINQTGKLAGAISFDGNDDHLRIPQASSLTMTAGTATLGLWVNWTQATTIEYQRLLLTTNSFANDLHGPEWGTNPMGGYYYYPSDAGGFNYAALATPFVNGTWHHVAITQEFATKTVALYLDGAPITATDNMAAVNWINLTTAAEWHWGGVPPRTKFAGMMDEIRVSKIVRSAAWIATEYANQSSPSTFYRVD